MPRTSKSSNFELDEPEFCTIGREPIAALLIRHGAVRSSRTKITCGYLSRSKIKWLELDRTRWYGIADVEARRKKEDLRCNRPFMFQQLRTSSPSGAVAILQNFPHSVESVDLRFEI